MEFNKNVAIRAKESALNMFKEGDVEGAHKLAKAAQQLYPQLEGISSLLAVLEVHISAKPTGNGEADWYKVLGVSAHGNIETISKQYRKMALIVHPDKNNAFGSAKAFRLIQDAFDVLKDDHSRSAYDRRMNIEALNPNIPLYTGGSTSATPPASSSTPNGVDGAGSSSAAPSARPRKKTQSTSRPTRSLPAACTSEEKTSFWTICVKCNMRFEYPLRVLDLYIRCSKCKRPFLAVEAKEFATEARKFSSSEDQSQNPTPQAGPSMPDHGSASSSGPSAAPAPGHTVKKGRKAEEDANLHCKRQKTVDDHSGTNAPAPEKSKKKDEQSRRVDSVLKQETELAQSDVRNMLIQIGFSKVNKQVQAWRSAKEKAKLMTEQRDEANAISVPDSDFHDFDNDRSLVQFKKDDLWAVYDDEDGMPRIYAVIRKVISLKPFKVEMSWLNAKTSTEFGTMEWIGHGFTKTCGKFRVGKSILNHSVNIFSHRVNSKRGSRGHVQVYPAKGEFWAVYKNWSSDWSFETPKDLRHVYEVLEVLSDYTEEQGVSVVPLLKVAGFHTVFSKADLMEVRRIRREEMFRFSHQIPGYLLSGNEAPNAPKGCLELDPASLSEELLKVILAVDNSIGNVGEEH